MQCSVKRRTKKTQYSNSNYEWRVAIVLYRWTTVPVNWFHFRSMSLIFFLVLSDFWHLLDIFPISLSGIALHGSFLLCYDTRSTNVLNTAWSFEDIAMQLCNMQIALRFVFRIELNPFESVYRKGVLFYFFLLAEHRFQFFAFWINFSLEYSLYCSIWIVGWNKNVCVCVHCA